MFLQLKIQLSINYHNPVLQILESFIEPIDLVIEYISDKNSFNESKLMIQVPDNQSLNINLTDFMIRHFMSVYYENHSDDAFSVFNNTGCTILMGMEDLYPLKIENGTTKPLVSLKENTKLSCSVLFNDSYTPTLSKIPLYSKEPQIHDLDRKTSILTEMKIVNFSKQLKISSPLIIKNETSIPLEVLFGYENTIEYREFCFAGKSIPAPLVFIKGMLSLSAFNTDIYKCEEICILSIKKTAKIRSGTDFFILDYQDYTLYIKPSLRIKNYLPMGICINFIGNSPISYILLSGEQKELYIDTTKPISCELNLEGFVCSPIIAIFDKLVPKIIKFENSKGLLEIGCHYSFDSNFVLVLYPLLLLVNHSLLPIEFSIKSKNTYAILSSVNDTNKIACSPVDSLIVRIGSDTSEPLDIKTKMLGVFEVQTQSSMRHSLVYQVFMVKIPDENIFTKVFSVNSRILITNNLFFDLKIIQYKTDSSNFIHIPASENSYFNWQSYEQELFLSVKVDRVSSD